MENKTETKSTKTAKTATKAAAKTTVKTAAKKASAAKTTAKKTRTAAAPEAELIIQMNGNDYTAARLLQSAKDVWQYDLGKNTDDFRTAQIYVKPEEGRAYVVVNGSEELSFAI